jgi:hypothetical protein
MAAAADEGRLGVGHGPFCAAENLTGMWQSGKLWAVSLGQRACGKARDGWNRWRVLMGATEDQPRAGCWERGVLP